MSQNEILIESESPYGFAETAERITKAIEAKEWKMPAVHDLQQTLKNFGKEVLPVKVFEICHPRHSGHILERDAERVVSALMPCRISVYERANGKVYISRMNADAMAASFGGIVEEVMTLTVTEVEQIIELAMK